MQTSSSLATLSSGRKEGCTLTSKLQGIIYHSVGLKVVKHRKVILGGNFNLQFSVKNAKGMFINYRMHAVDMLRPQIYYKIVGLASAEFHCS